MNRRTFLRRLGAAVVAATLARHLPGIAASPPPFPWDAIATANRSLFNPGTDIATAFRDGILGGDTWA